MTTHTPKAVSTPLYDLQTLMDGAIPAVTEEQTKDATNPVRRTYPHDAEEILAQLGLTEELT